MNNLFGRRQALRFGGAAGAAVLAGTGQPARAQAKKLTLRAVTVQQKTQESFLIVQRWADEVAKRSNGTVEIIVSGSEAVPGGERDALEGVRALGVFDICHVTTAVLSTIEPKYGLPDLPFLFPDREHAFKVADGPVGQALDAALIKTAALRPLMHTYDVMRQVNLASRPIQQVADFKGVKIRTIQADVPIRAFRALGANPVPMAATEVYTAIQTGVIDGWESPLDAIVAWKDYEVAKHVSLTSHQYADVVLCISEPVFHQQPKDIQDLLVASAHDLLADHRRRMTDVDANATEILKKAGVVINDIPDKRPFQEAIAPIYEEFGKKTGTGDLIAQVRAM